MNEKQTVLRRSVAIRIVTMAICLLLPLTGLWAYPVQPALSLTELIKQSDLICKVIAKDSQIANINPYRPVNGFVVMSTKLDLVEVYKGTVPGRRISFVHYTPVPNMGMMFMPQHYSFEAGRAYILFAKKTGNPTEFVQLWENHRTKEDQGLVRAADDAQQGSARPVREVLWRELTKSLQSDRRDDVLYAIGQLDAMSGGSHYELEHFARSAVLTVLEPLMSSQDDEIALTAIRAMGCRNPCMDWGFAPFWLASIGEGNISGFSEWNVEKQWAAADFWRPLAEVVDSKRTPAVRPWRSERSA